VSCKARRRFVALLTLISLNLACSRQTVPQAGKLRTAVLRFENLSGNPSLDWMGRAASEIIADELGGSDTVISSATLHANPIAQLRPISAPGESTEFNAAIAAGATRIVLGDLSISRNRLLLDVTVRDPKSGKTVDSFTLANNDPSNLFGIADAAAHRLSPQATTFETRDNRAIAAWSRAVEETNYETATGDYELAVQADPGFASAWLGWLEMARAHRDHAATERVLPAARQQAARFSPLDRARLDVVAAQLGGDRNAILAAMNGVARLRPDDPDTLHAVADQNYNARHFREAAEGYRRLTQLAPKEPTFWNQLGYTLMFMGDYDGAAAALQSYQKLVPNDPNVFDSQGDLAYSFGKFSDAERLYDQAGSLSKAAEADLLTGDVAGATKKFEAFVDARRRANDRLAGFRAAQWLFLAGRHDDARTAMAKVAANPGPPQLRELALSEMALWDLQLGARDRALQEATDAMKTGASSASTLIIRFAAENAHGVADWQARADRLLAAPQVAQIKPLALAQALYLAHEWQAAEPLWKALVERASPNDVLMAPVYGHILVELKREKDAEPYVRLFPLPQPNDAQEFRSLVIPRILATRAAVFNAEGKSAEAQASRKVFEKLWPAQ
jgi:tetratricopeptide (TPR) repeat protein